MCHINLVIWAVSLINYIKYLSYPKPRKFHAFEQKENMKCHRPTPLVTEPTWYYNTNFHFVYLYCKFYSYLVKKFMNVSDNFPRSLIHYPFQRPNF